MAKVTEQKRRRRLVFAVILEILVMAIGVVCVLLPMPWRLVVPIIIGAREIILKARRYMHSPQEPQVVHCCGGNTNSEKERKSSGKTKDPAQESGTRKSDSKKAGGKTGKR